MPEKFAEVLGSKIHYIEEGEGDPILLLHGMPGTSFVWRKMIPRLAPLGRCIAPDYIGMGKSDQPDISYTIDEHLKYLEKFIETLNLRKLTIVMHGWGSILGLHYALNHEENCKGLVFYEGFLQPQTGEMLSLPFQDQLALEGDTPPFDLLLTQSMLLKLSPEETKQYRQSFMQPMGLRVLKQYWQELPRGDGKSKVDKMIEAYSKKLTQSSLPKLLLYSLPGFINTMATISWAKDHLSNLEIGEVGEELHFAQEAEPELMSDLISAWLQAVEQNA